MNDTLEAIVAQSVTTDAHLIVWLKHLRELVAEPMDTATRAQLVLAIDDLMAAYCDSVARREELVG